MGREYIVKRIEYKDTKDLILNVHYAKRMPSVSYAYGLFCDDIMIGVCTYGSPASPWLCKGVCGEEHKSNVLELNRLVLVHNRPNEASLLVARSIALLPKPKVIVSYADVAQGHIGYVYQATNWLYTGATKARTDIASLNGKHPRHHAGDRTKRVFRSAKHRYVFMHGNKKERKGLNRALRYGTESYPKKQIDPYNGNEE
jgi:hypothetical protein|tara:strand:- start:232 stop:831 length:600 start_codon:yes stop_codon:yes gene_type:complete